METACTRLVIKIDFFRTSPAHNTRRTIPDVWNKFACCRCFASISYLPIWPESGLSVYAGQPPTPLTMQVKVSTTQDVHRNDTRIIKKERTRARIRIVDCTSAIGYTNKIK